MTKVWYKQDDTFFVPRVCINLKISRYHQLLRDVMNITFVCGGGVGIKVG